MSRQDAETGYRAIRRALLLSALCTGIIAAYAAVLEFSGWQILVACVVLEGILMPIFLRVYRRELGEKVRAYERSLS